MDRAGERLSELLSGLGFASYDEFMRTALVAEVAAREAAVAPSRRESREIGRSDSLDRALAACRDVDACRVGGIRQRLDAVTALEVRAVSRRPGSPTTPAWRSCC